MREPIWLERETVLVMHDRQLEFHRGLPGVRYPGPLDSALGRPQHLFAYGGAVDLADLAAAYTFVDGNKRTALVACRTFLLDNGRDTSATNEEKYDIFLRLGAGEMSEEALAAWLRARMTDRA